jgi:CheY-like chemotaxis protein
VLSGFPKKVIYMKGVKSNRLSKDQLPVQGSVTGSGSKIARAPKKSRAEQKPKSLQPAAISTSAVSLEKKSGRSRRILLVEDHEPTRQVLTQLLLHRHFKVAGAASFSQACSLIKKNKDFKLLISDIDLPDGNGHDLMSQFRKKFRAKGIALTAYGSEQDVAQSRASGFTAHLTKPIRMEALENALAAVLKYKAIDIFIQNGMPR